MSHALPSLCAHHYCPLAQIYTGMLNYQTAYVLPISVSKRHVPLMHSQYPVLHVAHHHLNSWLAICAVHPDTNTLQPLICGLAYQSFSSTRACVSESLTATLGSRELTYMRQTHICAVSRHVGLTSVRRCITVMIFQHRHFTIRESRFGKLN